MRVSFGGKPKDGQKVVTSNTEVGSGSSEVKRIRAAACNMAERQGENVRRRVRGEGEEGVNG